LSVAEHASFRHAATALGLSQSGISVRIKQLEQDLGILIFERRHRGVVVTEEGRRFLDQVADAIDLLETAVKTAGMAVRADTGRLRIGVSSSITGGFLADLFQDYAATYPDIALKLIEGRSRDAAMLVRQDKLDIAFIIGVSSAGDCHSKVLWKEHLVIALPKNHPLADKDGLTWRDISRESFIVRPGGIGADMHDHLVRRLSAWGFKPEIRPQMIERGTVIDMVAQGHGVALTTEATSFIPANGVVFHTIEDEAEPVAFSAIWSPYNRGIPLLNLIALATKHSKRVWPSN
jgi:DNA-binding transcriptional LysR family regulator